ncbi:MAG TPA: hypothetical protein VJX30_04580 [Terriglobales bacterium]|jgi:hypothetical protein|nr:hypothetical protein [Terriglobales bacterium]
MDNDTKEALRQLAEQFTLLTGQLTRLQSYVDVLLFVAAKQIEPDRPLLALKVLRDQAEAFLALDPTEIGRKEVAELIDALKQMKKTGSDPHEA